MNTSQTIVIADDHLFVRRTIVEWIRRSGGLQVVAECDTADAAIDAAVLHRPDLVMLDVDMPGQSAFAAADQIRRLCGHTRILFLSGHCHDRHIASALASGASGFMCKDDDTPSVLEGLRTVAAGGTYFSPQIRHRLAPPEDKRSARPAHTRCDDLSPREIEVLRYVAKGLAKREIAALMCLSPRTVERHVFNIMKTLDVHDRVELARFAIREKLVEA